MAWERGYYYRVRKQGGRVILDAIQRADREAARQARRAEKAELDALDARVKELDELADLLAQAALLAAVGYRQTIYPTVAETWVVSAGSRWKRWVFQGEGANAMPKRPGHPGNPGQNISRHASV